MAITRWARRAVLTATALAFALPFSTGTAQADPIIEILGDNNVNVTVGAYNNNVNSIPVSLGAGASLNTGSGITLDTNEGIQLAMNIGHADVWADASVGVPFTNIGVEASAAAAVDVPAAQVAVAPPPAEPEVAPLPAEPEVAPPPAVEATPILESAVTDAAAPAQEAVADEVKAPVTDDPKGDDEEDCPEEVEPSGCPNITALGILSVCLLPNVLQLHI
ncbi:hypothetical protein G7043_10490 [Lentzea sp. NEAU-D13]|uniref:Small secreted domain n=1 Tax=Lentzea alba TaxID=2714351 RepID=A0A7C9RNF8_9PSEU|nr:hypothetical protein [Lentzea alba]NGY59351.1 hypothetical protein [Lentzea alba]